MARSTVNRISSLTVKEEFLDEVIVLPNGQTQALRFVEEGLYKHLFISGYDLFFDMETEDITPAGTIEDEMNAKLGLTHSGGGSTP